MEEMTMSQQTFTITVNVKELLTEFIPKLVKEYVQMRGAQEELRGTELKLTLDISGGLYSYIIKDGVDFDVKEGTIDNPQVRISFSLESMSKMADMKNIDMLISMQKQLTRKKYDLLCDLKGTSVFQIKNPDETTSEITATFNSAEKPNAVLRLSMQDANLISSGKESPINLFMSGKMKIEGDMTFAMKLQPLFVA
jgi:hypothetical protein